MALMALMALMELVALLEMDREMAILANRAIPESAARRGCNAIYAPTVKGRWRVRCHQKLDFPMVLCDLSRA